MIRPSVALLASTVFLSGSIIFADEGVPLKGFSGPAAGGLPQTSMATPGDTRVESVERERPKVGLEVPEGEMDILKAQAPFENRTGGTEVHQEAPAPRAPGQSAGFGGLGQNGWIPYDA